MSQTGSNAPNLRAGKRSEYLANYIFSSFGACIPVPQSEDFGLDLYCVLTQDIGKRSWPTHHYTVQVKSNMSPWCFESKESVQWFIQHPLPLFFCIVDKKTATLRVYATLARHYLWAHNATPDNLEVTPEAVHEGHITSAGTEAGKLSLGAPILEFSVIDMGDEEFHKKVKGILKEWIIKDETNITSRQNRIRKLFQPMSYKTNESSMQNPYAITGLFSGTEEDVAQQSSIIEPQLQALMDGLQKHGDHDGALKALLLRRSLAGRKPKMLMTALADDIIMPIHRRMGFPIIEKKTSLEGGIGTITEIEYDRDQAISIIEAILDRLGDWKVEGDTPAENNEDTHKHVPTMLLSLSSVIDKFKKAVDEEVAKSTMEKTKNQSKKPDDGHA